MNLTQVNNGTHDRNDSEAPIMNLTQAINGNSQVFAEDPNQNSVELKNLNKTPIKLN